MKFKNKKDQQGGFSPLWFTLIEIMIWILIASGVIIIWFQAFNAILVWKVKLIESTNISKESFSFSQKFFEEIKKGWLIDYEEYFNRNVVWNTTYSSGHFLKPTWFWNYWTEAWYYYCRSNNWVKMTGTWCIDNFNNSVSNTNQNWEKQRYGQYSFQFIDYNSNFDLDKDSYGNDLLWDEDHNDNIIWDDDDEYLWRGPDAFKSWSWVTELYLISADKTKRTLFRWSVKQDLDWPPAASCNSSDWWKTYSWSWCVWTIEFLKLDWKDWWFNHNKTWSWVYDWVIDTWIIDKDFSENKNNNSTRVVAWSDSKNYWIPLFQNSINVKSFDVRAYPNKDPKLAWNESGLDVAPYVRINMVLTPSWKVKKKIKWKTPEFNISTTVNLTDIYSR